MAGIYWEKIYWGEVESVAKFHQQKFAEFLKLSPAEIKSACCDSSGKLIHIIRAEHFDLPFLEKICETASAARRIAQSDGGYLKSLLGSESILNYFNQPSSRTFLSFSNAEARLGMIREEVRDISTSSQKKGEPENDSLRTISSCFDGIVFRHPSDVYDLFAVWVMKNSHREMHVINGGSGKQEHPTQGVLDYYTIREAFQDNLNGKVIAYVGDCLRGRTVHSLAKIMSLHENTTAYFVAPDSLQIDDETENYIRQKGTTVLKEAKSLQQIVPLADVIYMTRIQNEHGGDGSYDPNFIFTEDLLGLMKKDAIVMHPMPKREEIDPALDYLKNDPRLRYWRQQENGLWTRVALLSHIFDVDEKIRQKDKQISNNGRMIYSI